MTPADWRALIEAYLDGRLSAEAFMRRFIEGWTSGAPLPRAVVDLQVAVELFEARVRAAGEDGATDDDDLRQAARRAAAMLSDEPGVSPHTFDRVRAREEMRRFQIRVSRLAGVGCALAAIWLGLSLLQIYFVSEYIHLTLGWGAWPSAVIGFFLAFVPIVGNVLAFLGATQEGWPVWLAALVFFAAPAATLISGWSRWRRRG
ncbi:MAG: hypothetical protein K2P58_09205 [Hyphomonadaceae bacterium]|nr:hypothetical protein [Hyphomonadaceae bacterium]